VHATSLHASTDSVLLSTAKILAVDDELAVRKMLTIMLGQQGISCKGAASAPEALEILQREPIDAVISDLRMSGTSGMELLRQMRASYPNVAFVMATGVADLRVAVQAMKEGADDYLLKPFDVDLVTASLSRALQHKQLEREVQDYRRNLERMVAERTQQLQSAMLQLERSYDATLEALGAAIDLRDGPTGGHSRRVLCYSLKIAETLGLPGQQCKTLAIGAWLHDIGKLAIPDRILLKPAPLTDDEFKTMQRHAQIGYDLVKGIPFLADAADVVRAHHERFDGAGYPAGLRGQQIPLSARIFALADALDAMTSDRPYRAATSFRRTRDVITAASGTQFDPQVVAAFLSVPDDRWEQIRGEAPTASVAAITRPKKEERRTP
jgi:response regulator RpfG family c-di-GMP phosphodiesterase